MSKANDAIRPEYPHGMFNATKCIAYLKWIGVEVTSEQERAWFDAEITHRFLKSMGRPVERGKDWTCINGHVTRVITKKGQRKKTYTTNCPHCGAALWQMVSRWWRARDSQLHDMRDPSERWRALDYTKPYELQDIELHARKGHEDHGGPITSDGAA